MTTQNPCPDADRLLGMLDCELEQIQQTEVAKHVNACDTCQLRLETLVTNGLREDLEFEHLATYLGKKDKEDLDFVLAPEEVGLMTETLLSTTASTWAPISLDFLEPSEERDVLGRLGQYQITDVIGRGGMGVALKARDTQLDRIVAVKVLAPELASNPTARRRFLREARAAAAVSHDHVVTVHAVEPGDLPYLAMEYIDGHSLQQRIDRDGPLKVQEILRVGMQTAYGLAAAHAQGLIHHDIKPSNIMLQNGVERVQITDFGLARAVDDVTITRTGEVRGTPQYMSPEQAQGKSTDQRSDLFSLGAVLYAMCTGRAPFRADSTMGVLHRVCNDAPRPIREVNPDIPAWLVGIIDRLLEKHPDDRYQTAEEVGDVLSGYLAHMQQPTVVPLPEPAPAAQRIKKQDSRRTKWIIGPIVALMLLVSLRLTEATGVTNLAGAVIRIATGEGTLVIEVDDPTIEVSLDGEELSITGAGIQELKLRPGQYQFQARKDGQPVKQELVTITRGGRQVVKVRLESPTIETQGKENTTDYRSTPDGAISEVRRIGREHVKNNWVTGLAFSTNGRHLMCAGRRPEYWDLETGKVTVLELGGDEVGCMSVAVSPDGSLAATGHFFEGLVRLWDLNTGEHVRDLIGHAPQVRSLAFSPDGRNLFSGSHDDKTARLWNVETGKETWRFDCDWPCFGVAFSPQGNTALVSDGSTLRVVAVRTGQEISRTALAIGQIKCADFSPDGNSVVSGTLHGVIQMWDAKTGNETRRFNGHTGILRTVRFLPDGRHLISGAEDKTMRLWNIETAQEVARIDAENHSTQCLAVSPDGRYVASGGGHYEAADGGFKKDRDYAIRLWRLPESVWPDESASAEKDAFVVLSGDGAEIAKFDTFAEAVVGSSPGDTIEIRGNGPFVTDGIIIEHPLVIRAGDGFRPVIIKDREHPIPEMQVTLLGKSSLVLEGLDLQSLRPEGNIVTALGFIRMANCRLFDPRGAGFGCIHCSSGAHLTNCLLIQSGHGGTVGWGPLEVADLLVENCVLNGASALYGPDSFVATAVFRQCTISSIGTGHRYALMKEPVQDAGVRVLATHNIIETTGRLLSLNQTPNLRKNYNSDEAKELFLRALRWKENANLYPKGGRFLRITDRQGEAQEFGIGADLEAWNRFWGLENTGSTEGIIRFHGGKVAAKSRANPNSLTAVDFRLRPDSAGYQAGPGGKDLGANIDWVGPGEAYEQWKQTPEYQQWQKETRELMKTAWVGHEGADTETKTAKESVEETDVEKLTPSDAE